MPAGVVSGVLVNEAVSLLGDREGLEGLLNGFDPETVEHLIERLEDFESAEGLNRSIELLLDRVFELELSIQPACEGEILPSAAAEDRAALRA